MSFLNVSLNFLTDPQGFRKTPHFEHTGRPTMKQTIIINL
jgi:hypothetical protein